jgi:hypothetical protein
MKKAILVLSILAGFLSLNPASAQDALDHWYLRDNAAHLGKVKFLGGMFVAVGGSGALMTSVDGKTWIARNSGTTADLRGVAYGFFSAPPNLFMAVGTAGTVITSPDGTNWTQVTTPYTCDFNDVANSGGKFVIATTRALTNQPNIVVSTDGTTWSGIKYRAIGAPPNGSPDFGSYFTGAILSSPGGFIATGGLEFADDVWKSSTGTSWTYVTNSDQVVGGIAYGNGTYIMVGWEGFPFVSTNLGNSWFWTSRSNLSVAYNGSLPMVGNDITFGNGTFLAASGFMKNGLLTTTNGVTWKRRSAMTNLDIDSAAFGKSTFVGVGPDGIYQSEPVATPVITPLSLSSSNGVDLVISGEIGRAYRLQTTTDFITWSDRWSFTNTSPSIEFTEPANTNLQNLFYRVVSP